jgi:hypothetical protein
MPLKKATSAPRRSASRGCEYSSFMKHPHLHLKNRPSVQPPLLSRTQRVILLAALKYSGVTILSYPLRPVLTLDEWTNYALSCWVV